MINLKLTTNCPFCNNKITCNGQLNDSIQFYCHFCEISNDLDFLNFIYMNDNLDKILLRNEKYSGVYLNFASNTLYIYNSIDGTPNGVTNFKEYSSIPDFTSIQDLLDMYNIFSVFC